ncbi:hypothetical protein N7335_02045 [Stutzerimonas stutzeri]|uniref:Uncharacterized protein n=1 Tax=Stutzerimonas stutzeri TaxID=316 RepID=A0AA42KV24_STUST|nr:hypothetical protein [Stutzerimonas stutzeri]MDH0145168.1 hypothetical protein [Stutzerimonas stutzeri]MDH0149577.1 hypothetical protein [Stutzerimonas stutzeri]
MTHDELEDLINDRKNDVVNEGEEILITYGEYDDYALIGRYICLITFSVSALRETMLALPKGQYPWREHNTDDLFFSEPYYRECDKLTNMDVVGFAIYHGYVRKNEIREVYFGDQYFLE